MNALEKFEAELVAGIHKSYGYRGDHTRTKMQVFNVDYTIQNVVLTANAIHFDVVMKPAIMYAGGAQFAAWEGEEQYEREMKKCARKSRLIVVPMIHELVTWQKVKYADLRAQQDADDSEIRMAWIAVHG